MDDVMVGMSRLNFQDDSPSTATQGTQESIVSIDSQSSDSIVDVYATPPPRTQVESPAPVPLDSVPLEPMPLDPMPSSDDDSYETDDSDETPPRLPLANVTNTTQSKMTKEKPAAKVISKPDKHADVEIISPSELSTKMPKYVGQYHRVKRVRERAGYILYTYRRNKDISQHALDEVLEATRFRVLIPAPARRPVADWVKNLSKGDRPTRKTSTEDLMASAFA
jgi:hypothetical protein